MLMFYLIISINSFLEAARAGIQPKTTPIRVDTPTAKITEPILTELLTISGVAISTTVAMIIPRINPIIPPSRHSTTLSTKN